MADLTDPMVGFGSGPLAIVVGMIAPVMAVVLGTLSYWLALRPAIVCQVPGQDFVGRRGGQQILQSVGG